MCEKKRTIEITEEEAQLISILINTEMQTSKEEIFELAESFDKTSTDMAINAYTKLALLRRKLKE